MEQSLKHKIYASCSFSQLIILTLDKMLPQFLSDSRWRDVARIMPKDEQSMLIQSLALILELFMMALFHGHNTTSATNKISQLISTDVLKSLTALSATAIQASLLRFMYNFEEVFKREQATKTFYE